MTDPVRRLTDEGIEAFRSYLERVRAGAAERPPTQLLTDPIASEPFEGGIEIDKEANGALNDRYEFGAYLRNTFSALSPADISRDYRLWNWLSLYFFEDLCPEVAGRRKLRDKEAYILEAAFSYYSYYRHLVRTAWQAVALHGPVSKILLRAAGRDEGPPLARSGEIVEQLASRQSIFGSATIIEGAYRLYFDEDTQRPKRGSAGSSAGSPRRLATVVQQLDLTYDLRECTVEQFLDLLPTEFNRWKLLSTSGPAEI